MSHPGQREKHCQAYIQGTICNRCSSKMLQLLQALEVSELNCMCKLCVCACVRVCVCACVRVCVCVRARLCLHLWLICYLLTEKTPMIMSMLRLLSCSKYVYYIEGMVQTQSTCCFETRHQVADFVRDKVASVVHSDYRFCDFDGHLSANFAGRQRE